jgi:hypothetical protein
MSFSARLFWASGLPPKTDIRLAAVPRLDRSASGVESDRPARREGLFWKVAASP